MKNQTLQDKLTVCFSLVIGLMLLPEIGHCKRVLDYMPPPFLSRFGISIITLAPVAVIFSLAFHKFYSAKYTKHYSVSSIQIFYFVIIGIVILGALSSARDALNDELWNPTIGGTPLLALIWPVSYLLLTRKHSTRNRVTLSAFAYFPSFVLVYLMASFWQNIGGEIGLPTTW